MAAYVTFLSTRGQAEFQTLAATLSDGEGGADGDPAGYARERLGGILAAWEKAESAPPAPTPPTPSP